MNKNVLITIVVVLVIALGVGTYFVLQDNNNKNEVNDNNKENSNVNDSINGKKILVAYYSAQNHTKNVATKIADNLNADVFEIEPKEKYTSSDLDWTDKDSRVFKEHDNVDLRNVELKSTAVTNWDDYDIILIGYPIWWGVAAWPVDTFVKANDFTNKIVIPFCTSASSGLGQSGKLLEDIANAGNWQEGYRFSSNASSNDIKNFTDNLIK